MTRFAARYPAAAHTFVSDLDDELTLERDAGHHLSRVRRLRRSEVVTAADATGWWRPYTVANVRSGAVELRAVGAPVVEPELEPRLAVAFAVTKSAKPDLVVEKLTELGVDRIMPLVARRSVPRWDRDGADAVVARLERIARAAGAQSRRARLPEIDTPVTVMALRDHPGLVVADVEGEEVTRLANPPDEEWVLVVGPEGGFDPAEHAALAAGARLRLGTHVLRAETAAIAGAAVLTTRRGLNFGHSG